MNKLPVALLLILCCMTTSTLLRSAPVNTEDFKEGLYPVQQLVVHREPTKAEIKSLYKGEKNLLRLERFQHHIQKQQQKNAMAGISDPVDRWFWFWIFGWGLGLILTILSGGLLTSGFLGIVWFVAFIGGSVSLIMWLVKKFG